MNKHEIIETLIAKAKELDEQGLYREADAVHEQLRIANQADNWQNAINGIGEAALWANPITGPIKGFQATKNWLDPMFAGLHDNTGAFQDALVQLSNEIKNSSISDLYKQVLGNQIAQAIQSAQQMNSDYFLQNHSDWANPNQTPGVQPQQNVNVPQAPARVETQSEILRRLRASSTKFRHVEAQQQIDDAKSLYSKANAVLQRFKNIIQTDTPGFKETLTGLGTLVQSLSVLAQQEWANTSAQQKPMSGDAIIKQIQVAQSDPAVQAAVKAYIIYGVKFGQDKMFAALNANAQLADISAFKMLVQNAWKPEYQKAWEQAYAKHHPQPQQPTPDWFKPQQFNLPQQPQIPSFQTSPGIDQLLNPNKR